MIAQVPYANAEDVDRTARDAHAAFLKWREVPVVDRVQVFYRYKDLLEKHAAEIARILSAENGKTVDDAVGSVRRAIQMVEVACGMPSLMMGQSLENVSSGIDCQSYPPAGRRVRRNYPLQLSSHGADVDVSLRHCLRQHVHPEAF